MIDCTKSNIEKVSIHYVGNKNNEQELRLSKSVIDTSDEKVTALLSKFFLSPFTAPEFNSFTFTNQDFTLNPLFITFIPFISYFRCLKWGYCGVY